MTEPIQVYEGNGTKPRVSDKVTLRCHHFYAQSLDAEEGYYDSVITVGRPDLDARAKLEAMDTELKAGAILAKIEFTLHSESGGDTTYPARRVVKIEFLGKTVEIYRKHR